VLGDTHGVVYAGVFGEAVDSGRLDDLLGRHPGDLGGSFRREVPEGLFKIFESLGVLFDEFFIVTCMMPLIRAVSVPGLCRSQRVANLTSGILRGSATISLAPLRTAFFMRSAMIGWFSVVLEPMTKSASLSSISAIELVMAPEPNAVARPATVALCQ